MKHVVIIGNGVAGITAARHIRKRSDFSISVISSETPYFFSRTALMYVYMGHLAFENTKPYEDGFWKKNRIRLLFDHAETIDPEKKKVILRSQEEVSYDTLIIATGSCSNSLGVAGEHLHGVQSLYSFQDLQRMEENTHNILHAVIVGGGLIGVELAEMLNSRKIKTTVLVREQAFWANALPLQEADMISRHIVSHGIHLRHQEELDTILGDDGGKVRAVRTRSGDEIACDFVAIAVGVRPNVSWLTNSPLRVNRGVVVNQFLETNLPHVYAIGDCVERAYDIEGRTNIEQVWYTARMMGETVAQTICGERTPYNPGPWFNSAKFFEIEFQTYGNVRAQLREDEADFYWEHSSGKKAMHFVWMKDSMRFVGINSFGIRLRHECFDRWLREHRSIEYVMRNLAMANFDPEFAPRHEEEINRAFASQYQTSPQ